MAFDIPRNVILPVDAVDVRLDPAPHPLALEHADEIEANWQREKAANPAFFDGTMVLPSALAYRDRQLAGVCHEIRFATFLYWRKHRNFGRAEHYYAHAALVTADNALLAIRMGAHTASPRGVYFAAGSFEAMDFRGGRVDIDFNMARELGEETGLSLDGLRRDAGYQAYSENSGTAIFRRYYLGDDAETAAEKVRAFVAGEADPEIEGPVIIRGADDMPDGIKPHMVAFMSWHFGL
jgi:hypothetical protein